jgi:hypothetical protein
MSSTRASCASAWRRRLVIGRSRGAWGARSLAGRLPPRAGPPPGSRRSRAIPQRSPRR